MDPLEDYEIERLVKHGIVALVILVVGGLTIYGRYFA